MKRPFAFLSLLISLCISCSRPSAPNQEKTAHVFGNCTICKSIIDQAAKVEGVNYANWNPGSKLLTFKIDSTVTNTNIVLKSVAEAGYDNEAYRADDIAYQKLPHCCQYERMTQPNTAK
jgi:hypothetical protein